MSKVLLKKYTPGYLAEFSIVNGQGVSMGYRTELKQELVRLIVDEAVAPSSIARLLAIREEIVETWVRRWKAGTLRTSIKERIYTSSMNQNITPITKAEFFEIVKTTCNNYRSRYNHTVEQFKYYYDALISDATMYEDYISGDGDMDHLAAYVECCIEKQINAEDSKFIFIPTMWEAMKAQSLSEDIVAMQVRLSNLKGILLRLNRSDWIKDPWNTTIYSFKKKPRTPTDILTAIYRLPECTYPTLARPLNLSDSYVYPHVRTGVVPTHIQTRVAQQVIVYLNNSYLYISAALLHFIRTCKMWDWEVLYLKECPVVIKDITDLLPGFDDVSGDDMLFGKQLVSSQYWSHYTPVWEVDHYLNKEPIGAAKIISAEEHEFQTHIADLVVNELTNSRQSDKFYVEEWISGYEDSHDSMDVQVYNIQSLIPRITHRLAVIHGQRNAVKLWHIQEAIADLGIPSTSVEVSMIDTKGTYCLSGFGDEKGICVDEEDVPTEKISLVLDINETVALKLTTYDVSNGQDPHIVSYISVIDQEQLDELKEQYKFLS